MAEAKWYVVHTFSGYENKVKESIETTAKVRHMENMFLDVRVPIKKISEVKDGVIKERETKVFPGYVFVNMVNNDETWYIIRNTRGVTGFVGPGSKEVPLSDREVRELGFLESSETFEINFKEGDFVNVVRGDWDGSSGKIISISEANKSVTLMVDILGTSTPIEISVTEIEKAF